MAIVEQETKRPSFFRRFFPGSRKQATEPQKPEQKPIEYDPIEDVINNPLTVIQLKYRDRRGGERERNMLSKAETELLELETKDSSSENNIPKV